MAPPTPVLTKDQIGEQAILKDSQDCKLKSLTQFQCQIFPPGGGEYICVPFKRVFQECFENNSMKSSRSSKKSVRKRGDFSGRIEVTSPQTNA